MLRQTTNNRMLFSFTITQWYFFPGSAASQCGRSNFLPSCSNKTKQKWWHSFSRWHLCISANVEAMRQFADTLNLTMPINSPPSQDDIEIREGMTECSFYDRSFMKTAIFLKWLLPSAMPLPNPVFFVFSPSLCVYCELICSQQGNLNCNLKAFLNNFDSLKVAH